ncbi:hypothetical protein HZC30_07710 [Candidatus Woesearchaeota archaeon]|nr:hypothetical protein [Candidatus Woesearchaeota archaeon]
MGKAKENELPDILLPAMDVLLDRANGMPAEEIIQKNNKWYYSNLAEVKGEDYLRQRAITPPEQWSNEDFRKKSDELHTLYCTELRAQEEARFEEIKEIGKAFRRAKIIDSGVIVASFIGLSAILYFFQERENTRIEADKAKIDYYFCQSLFQVAQGDVVRELINKKVVAPYSGRLCELVLAEGYKSGE